MVQFDVETITVDEITRLLNEVVARDQRTTHTVDTLAWYNDLNTAGVRYEEASAALSWYYAEHWPRQDERHRFRATAPVLIEHILKIHKDRLAAAEFVYQPQDPDETTAQFLRRLREQIAAIAEGRSLPQAATPTLTPRPVAALVAGVADARALPSEIAEVVRRRRPAAREVACPYCRAPGGVGCRNGAGTDLPAGKLHPSRVDVWATAIAACPQCRAQPGAACTELGRPYAQGAHAARLELAGAAPDLIPSLPAPAADHAKESL